MAWGMKYTLAESNWLTQENVDRGMAFPNLLDGASMKNNLAEKVWLTAVVPSHGTADCG